MIMHVFIEGTVLLYKIETSVKKVRVMERPHGGKTHGWLISIFDVYAKVFGVSSNKIRSHFNVFLVQRFFFSPDI